MIVNDERSAKERMLQIEMTEGKEQEERERNKKSNYNRWVQFNLDNSSAIIKLAKANMRSYEILIFIINEMDHLNAITFSYKVLEDKFGISTSTVQRALKVLKQSNLISVYKSGVNNVYVVNPDLFWKSYGSNIRLCKFQANIILAESEQVKDKAPSEQIKIKSEKVKVLTAVPKEPPEPPRETYTPNYCPLNDPQNEDNLPF